MEKFNKMLAAGEPIMLSIFRIMIGLLLFQYGAAKLLKIPVVAPFDKVQAFSLYGVAGMFELILGGLLILGLYSRIVAFILCGEMAFAYFIGHFPRGFIPLLNNGTLAIMITRSCAALSSKKGPLPGTRDRRAR